MSHERTVLIRNAMNDGNYKPDPNVVRRIDALMGIDQARYIDVRHTPEHDGMSGLGVVLTTTRVIHTTWSIPDHLDHGSGPSIWVTTWARRTLIRAEIGLAGRSNTYNDWSRADEGEWPQGALLSLEYEGRQSPLELPLKQDQETRNQFFKNLVPTLLADLDR